MSQSRFRGRPTRPFRGGRVLAALPVALIALVLSACGGAGGSEASSEGATPLTLGLVAAGHVPIAVAVEKGFFADEGLDVTVQNLSGGTLSAGAAFQSGAVDVAQVGAPGFIQDVANGAVTDAKVFGQLSDGSYDLVVSGGITAVDQLKGQPLGISGVNGQDQIVFEIVLKKYGIEPTDVTWITTGAPANRLTALTKGSVKAIIMPADNAAQSSEAGNILDVDVNLTVPNFQYVAKASYIASDASTLKKFLAAIAGSIDWIKANPEDAAQVCADYYQQDATLCASNIETSITKSEQPDSYTWQDDQAINVGAMETALNAMAAFVPKIQGLAIADLVDTSLTGTR